MEREERPSLFPARILGIESSCDETAAAVLENGRALLSSVVATQIDLHSKYGGVFPEVASRQHIRTIYAIVDQALQQSHLTLPDIDAIAVTRGPGLAGSLVVGMNTAKGLALASGLPLIGVNHLEGHIYSAWVYGSDVPTPPPAPQFPLMALLVSGGHTELNLISDHLTYKRLGATIDDAAGEAYDKVARLLGLAYPGGPIIGKAAANGNPRALAFPRGLTATKDLAKHRFDFSFSGLKTAVARWVETRRRDGEAFSIDDVAASFQEAVCDVLTAKAIAACEAEGIGDLLIGGGVAANSRLR